MGVVLFYKFFTVKLCLQVAGSSGSLLGQCGRWEGETCNSHPALHPLRFEIKRCKNGKLNYLVNSFFL